MVVPTVPTRPSRDGKTCRPGRPCRGFRALARQDLLRSDRIVVRRVGARCAQRLAMMKILVLPALLTACVAEPGPTTSSTDQDLSSQHSCPANVPAALAPAAD